MVPKVVTMFARTVLGAALLVPASALAAGAGSSGSSGEERAAPRTRHASSHHGTKRGTKPAAKAGTKASTASASTGSTSAGSRSRVEARPKEDARPKDDAKEAPLAPLAKDTSHKDDHDGPAVQPVKDAPKGEKPEAPPKQSLTPLPTIAAAMGTPLAMPIGTDVEHAKKTDADAKGHAREPRHTPIIFTTRPTTKPLVKPPCLREAVDVMRGVEEEKVTLTKCDGSVAPLAVEAMSILVRPGNAAKPAESIKELAKKNGAMIAPGIKRIDGHLVERLQTMVDHFAKTGATTRVFVVSGVRPSAAGSYHAQGKALDFKIDGVKNEELVAFCKTLPDTGCGFYPNSSFIHLDVRAEGAGHVSWIDASGPGESPKYVSAWPPPKSEDEGTDPAHLLAKLETELQLLPPPIGEGARPDTGSKSEITGHGHDDTPAAMLEREIDAR